VLLSVCSSNCDAILYVRKAFHLSSPAGVSALGWIKCGLTRHPLTSLVRRYSVCRLVYVFDVGSSWMENGATCALELHGNNGVVRRVSLRSTAYVYV
jgi:hypothetical protein